VGRAQCDGESAQQACLDEADGALPNAISA
jgi:hypothetical protein